eukprot:TRINITY_DN7408_c0_g1_i1.p1 TRINITY_DN7408_c0_g1~~TRINITY_DN7408_c0_g1_i1.p1  ORF type:complete len:296 (+),score=62.15 TRINITY_DN7408_c0_g1_i1:270-1157(+)
MEVQIMPALNIGGPWQTSADMIHPWSSLGSSAAGAAVEWQQDKGEKSSTWSQDAGAVWNADSPTGKNHSQPKPIERSSSMRPLSSHNRRKPLSVRPALSLAVPASPVYSSKTSPGNSNRSDLEDPDTPTEADSGKLASPRTCINCGTTKTPLWRNGPEGYKSLCNACGIRLKKLSKKGTPSAGRSAAPATPSPKPATKKRSSPLHRGGSSDMTDDVATPFSAKRLKVAIGPIKKRWVLEEEVTSSLHSSRGTLPKWGVKGGVKVEGYEDEEIGDGDLAVEHGAQLLMMLAYGFAR